MYQTCSCCGKPWSYAVQYYAGGPVFINCRACNSSVSYVLAGSPTTHEADFAKRDAEEARINEYEMWRGPRPF